MSNKTKINKDDMQEILKAYAKIQEKAIKAETEEEDCKEERKQISVFLWKLQEDLKNKEEIILDKKKTEEICKKIYKVEHYAMKEQNSNCGLKTQIDILDKFFGN